MISTFNLTPLATGKTGRDGHKTLRFYGLVRLVASCHSLLVLKYKEIILFHVPTCAVWQPLQSVVLVVTCYFELLSAFFGHFLCSTLLVSVCRLLLGAFLFAYWELVQLVSVVVPKLNVSVCMFGF